MLLLQKNPKCIYMISDIELQHFLPQQIKCRNNYMKIHFASAFPRQCFCRGWQDFKSLRFYLSNLGKNLTRSKLVKLLRLLHISPRIRSIMYTIIVVQMFLYKYCYMQCNVLFSYVKNSVLNVISDALFDFKSKDK